MMKMHVGQGARALLVALASALALGACGGSADAEVEYEPVVEETSGNEETPSETSVQIEGLMGTISVDAVQRGLESRMSRFSRCFFSRYEAIEVLGGRIEMEFRVHVDGTVRWVYPSASTVGDRHTERCILEAASGIRFQRPRGGEAEFSYPLELDIPEDVRPPLNWDGTRISSVLSGGARQVLSDCRPAGSGAHFHVTAYVSPGGNVISAGASANEEVEGAVLDCITDAVVRWDMPDPGSYPAKVRFDIR